MRRTGSSYIRVWGALVVLLPVLATGAWGSAGAEEDWLTLSQSGVAVVHRGADARYAARVLEIYETRGSIVAASMGLRTLEPVRFIIASTDEEFYELTNRGAPDWGVGCALSERALVVLKSPRVVSYPLQMEDVVVHELAHIAAWRVLRGIRVPRWFDEGVAMATAGEWRLGQSSVLAAAAANGRLIPLERLESSFPREAADAALAYAESFHAVRYLMERAGVASPGELVQAVAAAGEFNHAIEELTGGSRSEFEDDLGEFFARRFNWGLILSDSRLLFVLVAALFLVALAVRTRRGRRRMKEWEAEEDSRGGKRRADRSESSWE